MLFTTPTLDIHHTPLETTITLLWRKPKGETLPALEPLFANIIQNFKKQGPQAGTTPLNPWVFTHQITEHTTRIDENTTTWVTHSIVWKLNTYTLHGAVTPNPTNTKNKLKECRDLITDLLNLYPWETTYRARDINGLGDRDITITHQQMMKLLTRTRMTHNEYDWFVSGVTLDTRFPQAIQRLAKNPPTLSKRSGKQRASNVG